MITFTEYDENGRIVRTVAAPESLAEQNRTPGARAVAGVFSAKTHFIAGDSPAERPTQLTVVNGTKLTNLPIPCVVRIFNERFDVTDGEADITFPAPGTYIVSVESWPYLDFITEITT